MRFSSRRTRRRHAALVGLALLAALSVQAGGVATTAASTAVVDGRVTAADGYTKQGDAIDPASGRDFGDIFITQDASHVFAAVQFNALGQGDVLNENVYGDRTTYHDAFATGWTGGHTFSNLLGSDHLDVAVSCNGTVVDAFGQDYLYLQNGVYRSDQFGSDGSVTKGGPTASSSSMVWNSTIGYTDYLTKSPDFDPAYPTPAASTPAAWVWNMTYEFALDASRYAGCTPQVAVVDMHNSPAKPSAVLGGLVASKTVDKTIASPGDTLTYTITVRNGAKDVKDIDITDEIGALLAHGSLTGTNPSATLTGTAITWPKVDIAKNATATFTFFIHLNPGGWPAGTTTLPNTVVVPKSNCAVGSTDPSCRTTTTVTVNPNLVVRKIVDKTSADPGDTLQYTISVQNTGAAAASNVVVSDDISALLAHGTFVACSDGCTGTTTRSWTIPSLAAGATKTLTFSVLLATSGWPSGTTTLPNTVVVTNSNCTAGSTDPDCDTTTTVTPNPNVVVKKTVDKAVANAGDTLHYTITVKNTGAAAATNVVVSDDISALLAHGTFLACSDNCSGTSTLSWTIASLASNVTQTLTFSVLLDSGGWPAGTTTLPNTVVVNNSNCPPASTDPDCDTTTTVTPTPNVVVRKTVDKAVANPGDVLNYSLTIRNTGAAAATNVVVTDDISALLAHGTFLACSDACTGTSVLSWTIPTLPSGATRILGFSVLLASTGWPAGTTTLPNTVVVTNSNCPPGSTDPDCDTTTTVTPNPQLTVTKTVDKAVADPGDVLTYTITVKNVGAAAAPGVMVTDNGADVLAHGTFVSCSDGCVPIVGGTPGTFQWPATDIASGQTITRTWTVQLAASGWPLGSTIVRNTVVVANSNCPPGSTDPACNPPTEVRTPHLVTTKVVDKTVANPGDVLTYTITVNNTGTGPAKSVVITDDGSDVLAHATFVSCDGCSPVAGSPGRYAWPAVDIAAGQAVIHTWKVQLNSTGWPAGTTTVRNTVVVANSNCPPGSTDPACNPPTDVLPPGLVIQQTVCLDANGAPTQPCTSKLINVSAGDSFWWRTEVRNTGQVTLTDVTITDTEGLPQNLTSAWCSPVPTTLAVGQVWSCTWSRTAVEGTRVDTATADSLQVGPVTDFATVVAGPAPLPAIQVVKTANPVTLPAGGGLVAYSYVVTNKGNVPLVSVTLTDDHCAGVVFTGGDTNGNRALDLTEAWTYSCSATLTVTTTNVATAGGDYHGTAGVIHVTDTDTALVTVGTIVPTPGIGIVKTATPTLLPVGGGTVTYAFQVTNKGNVPLDNVTVVDDRCTPIVFLGGDTDADAKLDLTETWSYTCTATVRVTTTNTAVASGFYTDPSGQSTKVSGQDTATVTVPAATPTPTPAVNPTPTPTGAVEGATSPPSPRVTLPPTDAGTPANDGGRSTALVLALLAGLAVAAPILVFGRRRRT